MSSFPCRLHNCLPTFLSMDGLGHPESAAGKYSKIFMAWLNVPWRKKCMLESAVAIVTLPNNSFGSVPTTKNGNFWRIRPPALVYCQKGPPRKLFVKKDPCWVAARLARRHVARAAWADAGMAPAAIRGGGTLPPAAPYRQPCTD
jgi:hypothetical protein